MDTISSHLSRRYYRCHRGCMDSHYYSYIRRIYGTCSHISTYYGSINCSSITHQTNSIGVTTYSYYNSAQSSSQKDSRWCSTRVSWSYGSFLHTSNIMSSHIDSFRVGTSHSFFGGSLNIIRLPLKKHIAYEKHINVSIIILKFSDK